MAILNLLHFYTKLHTTQHINYRYTYRSVASILLKVLTSIIMYCYLQVVISNVKISSWLAGLIGKQINKHCVNLQCKTL